ncbi:MAG: translation initiation factor Sui1 [Chitinivibrionales bacterium]|nr:translation initiation factor Sui1 [Chitinivibrionales bacterium]MBD3358280.1 translation initiation factor Sui1 [Chitinivibrionales bacterium]
MDEGIVYSTDHGRMCPSCSRPASQCICAHEKKQVVKGDGKVRVGRQTKGRKGKGVTVVTGLPLTEDDLGVLAKELKRKCGSGGTVKDGTIEIQGDHRDFLVEELKERGYAAVRSGG